VTQTSIKIALSDKAQLDKLRGDVPVPVFLKQLMDATQVSTVEAAAFEEIPLDLITPNPYQIREVSFNDVAELASDIYANGLLQIPMGRRMADGTTQQAFGHRRKLAHDLIVAQGQQGDEAFPNWAQFTTMKMIIRPLTDLEMYHYMAAENGQRENPNVIEIARSIQLGKETFNLSSRAAGKGHGVTSDGQISDLLSLLMLPKSVQALIESGAFGIGKGAGQRHGSQLVRLVKAGVETATIEKVAAEAVRMEQTVAVLKLRVDHEINVHKQRTDIIIAKVEAKAVIGGNSSGGSGESVPIGTAQAQSAIQAAEAKAVIGGGSVPIGTAEVIKAEPAEPVGEAAPMAQFSTSLGEVRETSPQVTELAERFTAVLGDDDKMNEAAILMVLLDIGCKENREQKIREAIGDDLPVVMKDRIVKNLLKVL